MLRKEGKFNAEMEFLSNWRVEIGGRKAISLKASPRHTTKRSLGRSFRLPARTAKARRNGLSALRDGSNPRKAGQAYAAEFADAEPTENGAKPNLPSRPPSAQEIGIAFYTPDGVFRTFMKVDWWQPSPEIMARQEEFESIMHEKLLNGIPYSDHTRSQVENGFPEQCGCQFCRINDPFFGQAKDDKDGGYGT